MTSAGLLDEWSSRPKVLYLMRLFASWVVTTVSSGLRCLIQPLHLSTNKLCYSSNGNLDLEKLRHFHRHLVQYLGSFCVFALLSLSFLVVKVLFVNIL